MTDKTKKIIRLVYHVVVTAALVLAAACLIHGCVSIYQTGPNPEDDPFTREVVAATFAPIAPIIWASVGVAVVGFVLHPMLPQNPAPKADMTATACKRLAARTDLTACPAELAAKVRKEWDARLVHRLIGLGLLLVGTLIFLWYALDMNHFDKSAITPAMTNAMWVLLPCMSIPFAYGVFSAYFSRFSYKRELALLKQAPTEALSPAPASVPVSERWVLVARYAVLTAAVAAILIGSIGDGWADVLTKAINICTECIGLG